MAELPEPLVRYLAERDAQRAADVTATLAALNVREERLIREAAVMGYVQGRRHPDGEDQPKDSVVLAVVVEACLAFPDLYPVLSGVRPCGDCQHPKYAHRDSEDDAPAVCFGCAEGDAEHDYRLTT